MWKMFGRFCEECFEDYKINVYFYVNLYMFFFLRWVYATSAVISAQLESDHGIHDLSWIFFPQHMEHQNIWAVLTWGWSIKPTRFWCAFQQEILKSQTKMLVQPASKLRTYSLMFFDVFQSQSHSVDLRVHHQDIWVQATRHVYKPWWTVKTNNECFLFLLECRKLMCVYYLRLAANIYIYMQIWNLSI